MSSSTFQSPYQSTYQIYAPVPTVEITKPPRPVQPLTVGKVLRALFSVASIASAAWTISSLGTRLQSMCGQLSAFAGNCSVGAGLHSSFFRGASVALLACTAPAAGMRLKRWWAWVAPPVLLAVSYLTWVLATGSGFVFPH